MWGGMIWLILLLTALIAVALFLVGNSNSARSAASKYELLIQFALSSFGAFIGLLLSLFAHDYLKERDAMGDYIDSLVRVRDVAVDHMYALNDLAARGGWLGDPDAEVEKRNRESFFRLLRVLEIQTADRALALSATDVPLSIASSQFRSGLNSIRLIAQIKAQGSEVTEDIDDALEDSRIVVGHLVVATHAELAFARGKISASDLDTYYRCRVDRWRRPMTEKGYDEFCAQDMHKVERKLLSGVDDKKFRETTREFDRCLQEPEGRVLSTCAQVIRRLVR